MSKIAIQDFRNDVQQYIDKKGIDYNKDGYIDADSKELSELLSHSGVSDVTKLYGTHKLRAPSTNAAIAALVLGGGQTALALKTNFLKNASKFVKVCTWMGVAGALANFAFFAIKSFNTEESKETLLFQRNNISKQ